MDLQDFKALVDRVGVGAVIPGATTADNMQLTPRPRDKFVREAGHGSTVFDSGDELPPSGHYDRRSSANTLEHDDADDAGKNKVRLRWADTSPHHFTFNPERRHLCCPACTAEHGA